MAEKKPLSGDVWAFPEKSRTVNLERALTEDRLINIIKCTYGTDRNGFIIKDDGTYVHFVLSGYIIRLRKANNLTANTYAQVILGSSGIKGDANGNFEGLNLTTTPPSSGDYLQLTDSEGEIYSGNYIRFGDNAVSFDFGNVSEWQS